MSKFFRFLSFRGGKPPGTGKPNLNSIKDLTINSSHLKLRDGCEDLKESIEHYNQRCMVVKQLKEKEELYRLEEENNDNQVKDGLSSQPLNLKFLSFKAKNKSKTITKNTRVTKHGQIIPKDSIECVIFFLDQTEEHFYVPKKSMSNKLYEQVFYHLDLLETDYFGLQFSDSHNVQHWLDPTKPIKKQCKIGPPYQFFFRVKFYTVEPNNLKEELTRYFYFLQLKNDLRSGRLQCQQDNIAVELCALILQEELGDFDPNNHTIDTISEFRFLPESQQTEEFEEKILEKYRSTSYKAMSPAESELTFLNKAKWLEMYGVDMHCVYGRDGNEYKLGLTPSGILVFEEEPIPNSPHCNNNKIGLFYWPKIEKVMFSKKKFTILVGEDDNRGFKQEHTFIFNLIDEKACKHLWKCAVEYHAFFRLKTSLISNQFGLSGVNNGGSAFNGFIRRGSRFKGPERTEFQTHNMTRLTTPRKSVQFERRPSQRFSRRTTHANKRQKQQELKQNDDQKLTEVNKKQDLIDIKDEVKPTVSVAPQPLPRARQLTQANNQNAVVPCFNDSKSESGSIGKQSNVFSKPASMGCCKMQMSGSSEHDQKCNVFKAQQMQLKKEEAAASTSPRTTVLTPLNSFSPSHSTEKGNSETLGSSSKSIIDDVGSNLMSEDLAVTRKSSAGCIKRDSKLVDKVNIFDTLELTEQDGSFSILEKTEGTTTDQPLINLNESTHEPGEKAKEVSTIQNMIDQPGTSARFQDLKMTQI